MRDLIVFAIVLGGIPYALTRPFFGLMMFSWLAYMRPQDLCWGPAKSFRFSLYVAIAMFVGWMVFEKRPFTRYFPQRKWIIGLAILTILSVAGNDRIAFGYQTGKLIDLLKVLAISAFTVGLVDSKKRLFALTWVIGLSLAFYGVKGGIFGVFTGGRILQGPGGMLKDNNDLSLALNMAMPLVFYMGQMSGSRRIRKYCYVAVFFTVCAVIFTRSRGGFLTLGLVSFLMVMKSRRKAIGLSVGAFCIMVFLAFIPSDVAERLGTLKNPQAEGSASGRLHAWGVALNMAQDNPLLGVGFQNFVFFFRKYDQTPKEDWQYGKSVKSVRVAHNSYLQLLAETGGPALICFLMLLVSTCLLMRKLRRTIRIRAGPQWAFQFSHMLEVSMLAFVFGAMFLNRSHFDLLYHVVALSACTWRVSMQEMHERSNLQAEPVPTDPWVRPSLSTAS